MIVKNIIQTNNIFSNVLLRHLQPPKVFLYTYYYFFYAGPSASLQAGLLQAALRSGAAHRLPAVAAFRIPARGPKL